MTTDAEFILAHTDPGVSTLVPEVRLHLARQARSIFQAAEDYARIGERWQPYWAFAWPGGQALSRQILDNPELVRGKRIADVGSGSGLAAIAAMKAGARTASAIDPDPLACTVARLNAQLNDVAVGVQELDPLGEPPEADLVLIGDLVYEPELEMRVTGFLEAARRKGTRVLFGDRTTARRPRLDFALLAEYAAPLSPALADGPGERARVWLLEPKQGSKTSRAAA